MPLQNRVTPFSEIVAIPERGTMMGNRGILHDDRRRVRRPWAGKAWICCRLQFQGRRDPVMAPGHYTRLFFLDEPTALAAGHRPCAYCRRAAYNAFRTAWAVGNADFGLGTSPRATEIDRVIHDERLGPGGSKRLHTVNLASLPDGTFVTVIATGALTGDEPVIGAGPATVIGPDRTDAASHDLPALLRWSGTFWRWSPAGYREAGQIGTRTVFLLTPPSIVAVLANGYQPEPPFGLV